MDTGQDGVMGQVWLGCDEASRQHPSDSLVAGQQDRTG
jgi:hypothetical protein